jgi:radical SAM protein with 4Fe4S-binding SPASM domain
VLLRSTKKVVSVFVRFSCAAKPVGEDFYLLLRIALAPTCAYCWLHTVCAGQCKITFVTARLDSTKLSKILMNW